MFSRKSFTFKLILALLGLALLSSGTADAQATIVTVSADSSGPGTRLILSHARNLTYTLRESPGRIEIVYDQRVVVDPSRPAFDDALLTGYRLRGEHTLILNTGSGYTGYNHFELRNPFRLVIDVQGIRPEADVKRPRKHRRSETIVVIDPGHGGIEAGAIGPTGVREKDITLDLARRLRQALKKDRSISVVLTRDEDRLIGLDERTAIANHNRADLFISIHLNASPRANARGAETYYLSTEATDDEARTLAALENRAYRVEEKTVGSNDSKDVRSLELVLWDLAQNQYLAESSLLGERVQRQLNALTGTRDRGVRQAPFRVLMGATMPAVLVEAGFISNPSDEDRIKSLGYRNQVANALANAVREYIADLKRLSVPERSGRSGER